MENAKIQKLEPKEWLDRVIDNLDQLRMLDKVLRPDEVDFTCLDILDGDKTFPPVHLGAANVRFFSHLLGCPMTFKANDDGEKVFVVAGITYRSHYIFGIVYNDKAEVAE